MRSACFSFVLCVDMPLKSCKYANVSSVFSKSGTRFGKNTRASHLSTYRYSRTPNDTCVHCSVCSAYRAAAEGEKRGEAEVSKESRLIDFDCGKGVEGAKDIIAGRKFNSS